MRVIRKVRATGIEIASMRALHIKIVRRHRFDPRFMLLDIHRLRSLQWNAQECSFAPSIKGKLSRNFLPRMTVFAVPLLSTTVPFKVYTDPKYKYTGLGQRRRGTTPYCKVQALRSRRTRRLSCRGRGLLSSEPRDIECGEEDQREDCRDQQPSHDREGHWSPEHGRGDGDHTE